MAITAFPFSAVLDVSANTLLGNNTGSAAAAIALTATQVRTLLSVYTSAQVDTLLAAYQPLDSDLTAIAALTTTAFGRSLLTLADGPATRTAIGAGTSSFSGAYGDLSGVPATFTPSSHTHGNITNAGAIGATASLPIITGASGVLTAGAFGTTSGTFCQGNDSRLSDSRTPTAHKTNHETGGSDALTAADIGAAATSHTHAASDITSGTIATPRLASGTADATTFLRGDQTWAVPSGGGGGITSLNSLTTATQTFAVGTTGTNVAFSSASGVHTLNIPDASASARGVITTGTQTLAGRKTLSEVHVVGSSNLTQIDITPASGQSVNQQIWRTSAGVSVGVIDSAGRPVFGSGSWTLNSAFHAVAWSGATIGWASAAVTGTSTHDTGLVRDGGAGLVGLRASTTAHTLRVYNTYTSATSHERLNIAWASNICTIETDKGSAGGTLRGLRIGGSASALVGMYGATPIEQPTTAVDSASHELFAGNALSDADTFDGYTIAQVVKALRNIGVLA